METRRQSILTDEDAWQMVAHSFQGYHRAYLGNGYLAVQITEDGTGATDTPPPRSFVAGLYDAEKLVEIPRWSALRFHDGTNWFSMHQGEHDYRQVLDMKEGRLITFDRWIDGDRMTEIEISFFVSRDDPHLAVIEYSVLPHYDGQIRFATELNGNGLLSVRDPVSLTEKEKGADRTHLWLLTETPHSKMAVAQACLLEVPSGLDAEIQNREQERMIGTEIAIGARSGTRYVIRKFVAIHTSHLSHSALAESRKSVEAARRDGFEHLLAKHRRAWARLWETDILVEPIDLDVQRRIRASLFYIYCSIREGQELSVPPAGLSGDWWRGHVFWDADMWVLPPLLLLNHELARSLVKYRCHTLDGARQNAKRQGYQGADYAWESAVSGQECCLNDAPAAARQRHVTGDVAWAQWQYYLATGDREHLRKAGAEVIRETARFWASRVKHNARYDRYEIEGVMGPDETTFFDERFKGVVNNNCFTNAGAQQTLRIAVRASQLLGCDYPDEWQTISDKIYFPLDESERIFLEHDRYDGHEIKQSDAELVIYPLAMPMRDDRKAAMLDYYKERRPGRGSKLALYRNDMMASPIYAVICCELGRRQESLGHLQDLTPNFQPPFNAFSETPWKIEGEEKTILMTGLGGLLQVFLYGFGGIRFEEDALVLKPLLPPEISRLTLKRMHYRGSVLTFVISQGGERVEIVPESGNDLPAIRAENGVQVEVLSR